MVRGTQGLCGKKAALMASGPRGPGVWEPYRPEKESVVWAVRDWCSLPAPGSGPPLPPAHGQGLLTLWSEPKVILPVTALWPHLSSGLGPTMLGSRLSTLWFSAW